MTTKETKAQPEEPKEEAPKVETAPPAQEELPPIEEPQDKPPRRRPLSGRRKRSDAGKPRGKRTTATATPRAAGGSAVMTRKLRGVINTVGGVISLVEPFDGAVILQNSEALAGGWAKVADRHPRVRQAIDGMEAGGVYGAAIAATLAVAVPILAHHRMLPPALLVIMGLEEPPRPVENIASRPTPAPEPAPEPATRPAPPRTGPPRPASAAPIGTPAEGVPPVTAAPPMPASSAAPSGAPLPKAG